MNTTGYIGYDLGQVVRDFDVVRARARGRTHAIHRCDRRPRARD